MFSHIISFIQIAFVSETCYAFMSRPLDFSTKKCVESARNLDRRVLYIYGYISRVKGGQYTSGCCAVLHKRNMRTLRAFRPRPRVVYVCFFRHSMLAGGNDNTRQPSFSAHLAHLHLIPQPVHHLLSKCSDLCCRPSKLS